MDKQENDGKDKEKVNERGCHMEDDESPHPSEEQYERDGKKEKPHELTLLFPTRLVLFRAGRSVCSCPAEAPGLQFEKRTFREAAQAKPISAPEHAARLPEMLRGNSDPGRNVYFISWIELDCFSAASELHLNHLVIENLNQRLRGFVGEVRPTARNISYHFAILQDLKFGLALLRSKQIIPGINLSSPDYRGFMELP
jgi:hypothetical protein